MKPVPETGFEIMIWKRFLNPIFETVLETGY
jgi:hypothetical protein